MRILSQNSDQIKRAFSADVFQIHASKVSAIRFQTRPGFEWTGCVQEAHIRYKPGEGLLCIGDGINLVPGRALDMGVAAALEIDGVLKRVRDIC